MTARELYLMLPTIEQALIACENLDAEHHTFGRTRLAFAVRALYRFAIDTH